MTIEQIEYRMSQIYRRLSVQMR